jgi:hypothetical protein
MWAAQPCSAKQSLGVFDGPSELATRLRIDAGANSITVAISTQQGNGKHEKREISTERAAGMTQTLKSKAVDLESLTSAADLPEDYISEEMLKVFKFHFNLWFVSIEAVVDTAVPSVDLAASILGVTIGRVHIDPKHPKARIGGSVGPFKALLELELVTTPKPGKLIITLEGCAPIVGCKKLRKEITL